MSSVKDFLRWCEENENTIFQLGGAAEKTAF